MDEFLALAQQLTLLFDVRPHPEGRRYTMQEVREVTGGSGAVPHTCRVKLLIFLRKGEDPETAAIFSRFCPARLASHESL